MVRRVGGVDYCINMHDKRKRERVLHVNMLEKWEPPVVPVYLGESVQDPSEEDISVWEKDPISKVHQVVYGSQLSKTQKDCFEKLLR